MWKPIAAILGLILVAIAFWSISGEKLPENGKKTSNVGSTAASPPSTAEISPGMSPPATPASRRPPPSVNAKEKPRAELVPLDAEHESEAQYKFRKTAHKAWSLFQRDAKLTEDESTKVLQILADAQANLASRPHISWKELDNAQKADPEFEASVDAETMARIKEVLPEKKFLAFKEWIPVPHAFLVGEPIKLANQ